MSANIQKTLDRVGQWYTKALGEHGIDAKGVGWTNEERHNLRFELLSQLCNNDTNYTINDLGCGYGALYNYLIDEHSAIIKHYYGYDISADMIKAAQDRLPTDNVTLLESPTLTTKADYTFASGIFNVMFDTTKDEWKDFILKTLQNMYDHSDKGFAFNLLTSYVDWQADDLYYADPCFFFDYCKKNFSRKVTLLHDTDLYEWTMIVRK